MIRKSESDRDRVLARCRSRNPKGRPVSSKTSGHLDRPTGRVDCNRSAMAGVADPDRSHAMKTLVAFLLLVAFGCWAQETSGITNKVTEIDRDKDGKIDVRIETFYRGKTKVMMIISRRNQQGAMAVISRSYLADGKLVMVESNEDGDGTFESITVFRSDADSFEMFTRQPDGTVKPVSTQKLDSIKRQKAVADASMRELFAGPEKTDKEIGDLLEKNRQKIEAIKKEKKDGD